MQFVARGLQGVAISTASQSGARVLFTKELPGPCTVSTAAPFKGPGRFAFQVALPVKDGKTGIGFQAKPSSTYMTPTYTQGNGYRAMGGAGFIYPETRASGSSYKQGSVVRVELELEGEVGTGVVHWFVNGKKAGQADWDLGHEAYPAISCEKGVVQCDVEFMC